MTSYHISCPLSSLFEAQGHMLDKNVMSQNNQSTPRLHVIGCMSSGKKTKPIKPISFLLQTTQKKNLTWIIVQQKECGATC